MYEEIELFFAGHPKKQKVVETFLKYGISIDENGKIYCGEIELCPSKVGRALKIDRRVVIETAKEISKSRILKIFKNIRPTAFISNAAKTMNSDVIEIEANPVEKGVVSEITSLISKANLNIRQIVADDPGIYPNPKLTIVVDGRIPGKVIEEIKKNKKVRRISIE